MILHIYIHREREREHIVYIYKNSFKLWILKISFLIRGESLHAFQKYLHVVFTSGESLLSRFSVSSDICRRWVNACWASNCMLPISATATLSLLEKKKKKTPILQSCFIFQWQKIHLTVVLDGESEAVTSNTINVNCFLKKIFMWTVKLNNQTAFQVLFL